MGCLQLKPTPDYKSGQMEIMGLVVVVILISLGLLFALQFVVLRGADRQQDTFTQDQIAESTLNSLLLTSTDCLELDFTELVKDCAGDQQVVCAEQPRACDYIAHAAGIVLDKTVLEWGKNYHFKVFGAAGTFVNVSVGECPGAKDISEYPIPLRSGGERAFARLEICER